MLRVRLTEVEAVLEFRDAGLVPLERYPGRTTRPWRAVCERCGREVSSRTGVGRLNAAVLRCPRQQSNLRTRFWKPLSVE